MICTHGSGPTIIVIGLDVELDLGSSDERNIVPGHGQSSVVGAQVRTRWMSIHKPLECFRFLLENLHGITTGVLWVQSKDGVCRSSGVRPLDLSISTL